MLGIETRKRPLEALRPEVMDGEASAGQARGKLQPSPGVSGGE